MSPGTSASSGASPSQTFRYSASLRSLRWKLTTWMITVFAPFVRGRGVDCQPAAESVLRPEAVGPIPVPESGPIDRDVQDCVSAPPALCLGDRTAALASRRERFLKRI